MTASTGNASLDEAIEVLQDAAADLARSREVLRAAQLRVDNDERELIEAALAVAAATAPFKGVTR